MARSVFTISNRRNSKDLFKPIDLSKNSKSLDLQVSSNFNELVEATPVKTGKTRDSWYKNTQYSKEKINIEYSNDNNAKDGTPVVALIVNGHGLKQGGYIPPNDFLSPVINKLDEIVDKTIERGLDGQ